MAGNARDGRLYAVLTAQTAPLHHTHTHTLLSLHSVFSIRAMLCYAYNTLMSN